MQGLVTVILSIALLLQGIGGKAGLGGKAGVGGTQTGPPTTPAILQFNMSLTDGVFTTTLPSHTAGGMSCAIIALSTATPPTISNTAGFTWSSAASNVTSDAGDGLYIFCATKSVFGSTDTVTVSSAAFHGGLVFVDISNVSTVDASGSASAASFSTPSSGNFSVTGANDMVLGLTRASGSSTSGTGYTQFNVTSAYLTGGFWVPEYEQITGTPANVSVTGAANPWDTVGVALK